MTACPYPERLLRAYGVRARNHKGGPDLVLASLTPRCDEGDTSDHGSELMRSRGSAY